MRELSDYEEMMLRTMPTDDKLIASMIRLTTTLHKIEDKVITRKQKLAMVEAGTHRYRVGIPNAKNAPLWRVAKAERPVCSAMTRKGTPCKARAVPDRERCRLHGGCSTGPRTEAGRQAIAESNRRRALARRGILDFPDVNGKVQ